MEIKKVLRMPATTSADERLEMLIEMQERIIELLELLVTQTAPLAVNIKAGKR